MYFMKTLALDHSQMQRTRLLKLAEEVPGAWIGLRIAGYLLMLEGWNACRVARLFGLSRWAVSQWVKKANQEGLEAVKDHPRPGRPSQFGRGVQQALTRALARSPKEYGIARARWDGLVVVEYLHRFHGVGLKVRQAQRWIGKLGFSLRQPIYRFVQATEEGVKSFRQTVKKTSGVASSHES